MANPTYVVSLDSEGVIPALAPFTTGSLANAQGVAQTVATLLQRTTYLAGQGVAPGYTAYTPAAAGSALTAGPTDISF